MAQFEDLSGEILQHIKISDDKTMIHFITESGRYYKMYHQQDCCEEVYLEDICGDIEDLLGSPILHAVESSQEKEEDWEHTTWTFYKLSTIKGSVTLRWYGTSNGYYSESVNFEEVKSESLPLKMYNVELLKGGDQPEKVE